MKTNTKSPFCSTILMLEGITLDTATRDRLRENRTHGSNRFPLVVYRMDIQPGEPVLDCHWHEEAEFFYMAEGKALFQTDADYFLLQAGEAAFIDGGDIHAAFEWNGLACTYYAIVFDPRLLESLSYDAVQESVYVPFRERTRTFPRHIQPDAEWKQELLRLVQAIIGVYETGNPGFHAAIKGYLYLMLAQIAEEGRAVNRSVSKASAAKNERLKKTLLYIQEHYDRPIQIKELAGRIPMSEGQFCRFFKSMTRQTPVEYLNAYRIKRSVELLRRTERKISDIALEVGFDHISYFVKVFRRIMKVTPSQYRGSLQEKFPVEEEITRAD
jgi:AraC-like DNA-binding protein